MPHLAFFAAHSDVQPIFTFIFAQTTCQVLEAYSEPDRSLRTFSSPHEAACAAVERVHGMGFMLFDPSMGGNYAIDRITLNPGAIPAKSWREAVHGWGLIQLEFLFGTDRNGLLHASFTNHNSEKRARAWAQGDPANPSVDAWDFRAVTSISRRINRHIREKLAVDRIGSRPVLPGALHLAQMGSVALPAG